MQTRYMAGRHTYANVSSSPSFPLWRPLPDINSGPSSSSSFDHADTQPHKCEWGKKRGGVDIIIISDRVQQTNAARTCPDVHIYTYIRINIYPIYMRGTQPRGTPMEWQRWLPEKPPALVQV